MTAGAAVVHDGYASVYTGNAARNQLQESYRPGVGQPWKTQDLSTGYGPPAVATGTTPVLLVHAPTVAGATLDHDPANEIVVAGPPPT